VSDASNVGKPKTNAEIRRWYLKRVATIADLNQEWINRGLSALERAEAAWGIRYEARLAARSMMVNKAEVELLSARDMATYGNPGGPTFDFLVSRLKDAGLEGDAVYEAVIDASYKTDAELNSILGL
jgi:hypothetical protein